MVLTAWLQMMSSTMAPWGFDLAEITAPTLIMHGTGDRMVPSSHGEWLAAHCPAAELRLQPGAGHISVLDSAPGALAWLRQVVTLTMRIVLGCSGGLARGQCDGGSLIGRPQVRVNQLGYLPGRPKQATLISDAQDPVPFAVRDRGGVTVYTGFSQPWLVRPEPTSGLNVHVLDFSGLTMQGAGFRIESADQCSYPFEVTSRVYDMLRTDALGFFYVMRSGTPILDNIAPGYGRPAGHAGRSPNRGDFAVPAWTGVEARRLYPGWRCKGTFDVSGGWYDAGDYGKYVTSGGIAVWQLLSTLDLLRRADSSLPVREFADLIRERVSLAARLADADAGTRW